MMARVRDLVRDDVPMRLIVIGDGPQRARLERRVHDLGMSGWVDLPGQLPRSEIRDVLAAADLYVAPAVLESFGIAALEARSAGLPVVAKACGGVGEFVTGGTEGVLATTDQDMARALSRLIESPGLRPRSGRTTPPRLRRSGGTTRWCGLLRCTPERRSSPAGRAPPYTPCRPGPRPICRRCDDDRTARGNRRRAVPTTTDRQRKVRVCHDCWW